MTFTVKPLDNDKIHGASPLPRIPATINVVGPKRAGKGTTLICLLTDHEALRGQFTEIYLFSPTAHIDDKYGILTKTPILKRRTPFNPNKPVHDTRDLCVPESNFISEIADMPEKLRKLYRGQDPKGRDYAQDPYKIDNICIILDDLAGTNFLRSKFLDQYIAKSRHFKTTFIFCVQLFKSLTTMARNNGSYYILLETWNQAELRKIYDECGGQFTYDEFCTMARDVWKKDHAILSLNLQNPLKYRYVEDFQWYLVRDNENKIDS